MIDEEIRKAKAVAEAMTPEERAAQVAQIKRDTAEAARIEQAEDEEVRALYEVIEDENP